MTPRIGVMSNKLGNMTSGNTTNGAAKPGNSKFKIVFESLSQF